MCLLWSCSTIFAVLILQSISAAVQRIVCLALGDSTVWSSLFIPYNCQVRRLAISPTAVELWHTRNDCKFGGLDTALFRQPWNAVIKVTTAVQHDLLWGKIQPFDHRITKKERSSTNFAFFNSMICLYEMIFSIKKRKAANFAMIFSELYPSEASN